MNRAWIPAGALAGVSVAGLIAMGHLTDSLGTPVTFHPTLAVTTPAAGKTRVLPVSINVGTKGDTSTNVAAAVKQTRGGAATVASTTNPDVGEVGFHKTSSSSTHSVTAVVKSTPKPKPKKTTKRLNSIGADSGPNGDNGLAGAGSGSSTNVGAQSGTPGSATP